MLCQQFALQFLNLSLGIYTNFKLHLVKHIKGNHRSNYEYYFLYQRFVHKSENQISRNSQKSQIYGCRINKRPHIEILSRRIRQHFYLPHAMIHAKILKRVSRNLQKSQTSIIKQSRNLRRNSDQGVGHSSEI